MTVADEIIELLKRKRDQPNLRGVWLTAEDIAEFLYGQEEGDPQKLRPALTKLYEERKVWKLERQGRPPYTYRLTPPPPIRRRVQRHDHLCAPFLVAGGSCNDFRAGIAQGWLWRHESGTYVKFTDSGRSDRLVGHGTGSRSRTGSIRR
jgi:hypothetical protein